MTKKEKATAKVVPAQLSADDLWSDGAEELPK